MIESEQSMNLPVLVARELVSPTAGNVPVRLFNPGNGVEGSKSRTC